MFVYIMCIPLVKHFKISSTLTTMWPWPWSMVFNKYIFQDIRQRDFMGMVFLLEICSFLLTLHILCERIIESLYLYIKSYISLIFCHQVANCLFLWRYQYISSVREDIKNITWVTTHWFTASREKILYFVKS